jgi:hypothetical protein
MMPACKNSKFLQSKISNKKSFRGEKINVPIPDPQTAMPVAIAFDIYVVIPLSVNDL